MAKAKIRYFVGCKIHGKDVGGAFRGVNGYKEVATSNRKSRKDRGCPLCKKEIAE